MSNSVWFAEVEAFWGFDHWQTPAWLSIPAKRSRRLVLVNGKGLKPSVNNRNVVVKNVEHGIGQLKYNVGAFKPPAFVNAAQDAVWEFTGATPGTSVVEAKSATSKVAIRLSVAVGAEQKIWINVLRLKENNRKSKRSQADLDVMVKDVNRIFSRQCGVVFIPHWKGDVVARQPGFLDDLLKTKEDAFIGMLEDVAKENGARDGQLNVFLVRDWKLRDDKQKDVAGTAYVSKHLCLVEDVPNLSHQAHILAHELGHLLGLGHHSENDALMLPTAEVGDTATRRRLLATDVKTIYAKKPAP